jgi:site-specific DNA-methyltransferase (adenine-specific)
VNFVIDQRDAVEWLLAQEAGSLALVATDPAYESLEKHRAIGTTTRLKKAWFEIFPNERFPALFAAAYRALAKNSHLYVICDETTADIIKPIGRAAGFTFWKSIVWDKRKIGMGYHYRARSEWCLFFEKGKRKLNDLGMPDVLEGVDIGHPSITDTGPDWIEADGIRNGYPTQKPVELLKKLISQSSSAGELVADPFGGSFSTGQAAMLLGRRFTGCDISATAVEDGRRKLAETPFLEGRQ